MLEYHAAYYQIEDGWYMAEVLDFPGAVSQGRTLRSARRMIRDALEGLAEFIIERGEALPRPDPKAADKAAVFQEKIPLKIRVRVALSDETSKTAAASSTARVRLRARGRQAHDGV
jgi:predicted RNase H-like HicB family nuclease